MSAAKKAGRAKPRIIVTGDLSIDWFEAETAPGSQAKNDTWNPRNWRTYPVVHRIAKPGGAWLMAEFIGAATDADVHSPGVKEAKTVPATELVHSYVELGCFPLTSADKDGKTSVFRVKSFRGFSGPEENRASTYPFRKNGLEPDIIVLDDAANGFREHESLWPADLLTTSKALIVVKMSRPLAESPFFKEIRTRHADRLILILSADDLRREGIKISRRLSWERTAKELVWQIASNPALLRFNSCAGLVVRFGVDGAIFYSRFKGSVDSWLIYDPVIGEDGFGEVWPGEMIGTGSAFAAGLVGHLAKNGLDGIREGVHQALHASRRLWQAGFGGDIDRLDYPGPEIFQPLDPGVPPLAEVAIPPPTATEPADPNYWCILETLSQSRADLESVAYNFVVKGRDPLLDKVPSGQFRRLTTFDRSEIESYQGIKNLICEYLESPSITRPLSIAVFGAPGAGKSFGVTQVAISVASERLEKVEFNLSQFTTFEELVAAFHKVRDIAFGGKVPIVFFDEFDSEFDNKKLGWLKYFLAPMQDGKFSDGHSIHPIGRAIFVFAGGTHPSFGKFCCAEGDAVFTEVKGFDFVSRLRGFINIKGPNPVDDDERLYMIRRAQVLRSYLLETAPRIFDGDGNCRMDPGVLRAMIKVPKYYHGIRSIQAIIDMSLLAGRHSFEQAALPSPEQLEAHVNAEIFSRLVVRDVLLGSAREVLARSIHEKFRKDNAGKKPKKDRAMVPWSRLDEDLKESNRQQADHIPQKLKAVGCDFAPVSGGRAKPVAFTPEEIEIMAGMEHDRWVAEKFLAGFSAGPRDPAKKTHPYVIPWDDLSDEIKEYDRQAVRAIPDLLASAGFEIYRLKTR